MRNNAVELSIPANRELMLVVRLATSGALARAGLSIDAHDDMKMAVEEACLCLIDHAGDDARLSLKYDLLRGAAGASIALMGQRLGRDSEAEIDVVRCILEALVQEVNILADEGGIASIVFKSRARE